MIRNTALIFAKTSFKYGQRQIPVPIRLLLWLQGPAVQSTSEECVRSLILNALCLAL